MKRTTFNLFALGLCALLAALSCVPQASAQGCRRDYAVKGSGGSGKTFSTWVTEATSPPQDAYLRLYHEVWKEEWRDERGSPQTFQISAVNSASPRGRPQRLLIEVSPQGEGSRVFVSFHILPGDYASNSVTLREMCGMIADAFRGPARWLPAAQSALSASPAPAAETITSAASAMPSGAMHGPDVMKFVIGGVRLGMSYPQALLGLANFLHVKRSAIRREWASRIAPTVPGEIYAHVGHNEYTVMFAHRLPVSKRNPAVVDFVEYNLLPWTSENARAMRQAAIKKYGAPTTVNVGEGWCSKSFSGLCASDIPVLHCCMGLAGVPDTEVGAGLVLSDPEYTEAWNHYLNMNASSKPSF